MDFLSKIKIRAKHVKPGSDKPTHDNLIKIIPILTYKHMARDFLLNRHD